MWKRNDFIVSQINQIITLYNAGSNLSEFKRNLLKLYIKKVDSETN